MRQDAIREAIRFIEKELDELMTEVRKKQQAINVLHESIGEKPIYEIEDGLQTKIIGRSQFYGKSFAAAAREFLEIKGDACTPEEIFHGLTSGAFDFPKKWKKEPLRMVSISLSKNSTVFHKLPNGTVGLLSWYPDIQKKKTDTGEQNNGNKQEDLDQEENIQDEQTKEQSKTGKIMRYDLRTKDEGSDPHMDEPEP